MHLKVFTKCQMLCNAYDDMSGFSILNTRGVTIEQTLLACSCARHVFTLTTSKGVASVGNVREPSRTFHVTLGPD